MRPAGVVCAALALATLATFSGVAGLGFVFDDWHYIHLNPAVARGLSWPGVSWALTSVHSANWHPLTWLSHMLDVTLFGLAPAGPHVVNLLFHAANALLVFLLLRSVTGALWRPALVAALFALHPLRVESVAWIAERKDVLSGFLGLLTLIAYGRYARSPRAGRAAVVAAALTLGLLAKPMLVSLPAVLLLLDWWPLGRLRLAPAGAGVPLRRLVAEKLPLAFLAAGSAWVTVHAQRSAGAVVNLETLPVGERLAGAAAAYARYLAMTFWPADLVLPYPRVQTAASEVLSGAALLAALGLIAWRQREKRPFLAVGFLWFAGMLLPVIGIVQVGGQRLADRYTYLPLLGVGMALAWGVAEVSSRRRRLLGIAVAGACVAVTALAVATRAQVRHWTDDTTLFGHALEVSGENAVAHNNLGNALRERGRLPEAESHFREAIRIAPAIAIAHFNLARLLAGRGEVQEAEGHLRDALAADPALTDAHDALGDLLVARGSVDEGGGHYREALRLRPGSVETRERLIEALVGAGRSAEAEAEIREALRLDPAAPLAHRNLAVLLDGLGRDAEAIEHYREALRLAPGAADVAARLRELLAKSSGPGDPAGRPPGR